MPHGFILPSLDISSLVHGYQTGSFTPGDVLSAVVHRLKHHGDPAVWIHRVEEKQLQLQIQAFEKRRRSGESLPLYGVPFAVKDNIDVAGCPTTSACPAYSYEPAASAPVVSRLLDAGAIIVGKTNMDQFGTGLAGDRSPYGACRNVFKPERISGGSSSGSAVAVAAGLVSFALGSDTAGSGRVPAGCNNIVGLKPTPGFFSTRGLLPNCQALDGISIFALTVHDATRVGAVVSEGRLSVVPSPAANQRWLDVVFAVPRQENLEFYGDDGQAKLFAAALAKLEQLGAKRRDIDFEPYQNVAGMLYGGPWVAQRLANIEAFWKKHAADMHPVTRGVTEMGTRYSAVDVFKAQQTLRDLRDQCLDVSGDAEVLVVPTMPAIPTLAEVQADSAEWSRRLGYYTNFANLLGMAAVAVPSGFTPQGLPGGITLLGQSGSDQRLCDLASAWQSELNLPMGATERLPPQPIAISPTAPARGFVRVAVAGAHLQGQPLHPDLRRTGARFVRSCRTASRYRFIALMDLKPPRPGLLRDDSRAGAVDVEIYDLPMEGFGTLVASVAPPLAIGTIELADGEAVKGFLCESFAAARARDITEFGGWVAFRKQLAQ